MAPPWRRNRVASERLHPSTEVWRLEDTLYTSSARCVRGEGMAMKKDWGALG